MIDHCGSIVQLVRSLEDHSGIQVEYQAQCSACQSQTEHTSAYHEHKLDEWNRNKTA